MPQWSDTLKERFFGALDTKTKLGFGHAHCCCESHSTPVGPPPSSFCSSSLLTSIHLPSHSFSSLIPHSATWGQFQTFTSFFFLLFPRLLLLAFTKLWWKGKDGPSALWFVHWAQSVLNMQQGERAENVVRFSYEPVITLNWQTGAVLSKDYTTEFIKTSEISDVYSLWFIYSTIFTFQKWSALFLYETLWEIFSLSPTRVKVWDDLRWS